MAFLPDGYSTATVIGGNGGGGKYFKVQPGENKVRILGNAIVGYLYWNLAGKPVRSKEHPGTPADIRINDDGKPDRVKHFWAVPVWDYSQDCVAIWEITQRGIQEAIADLYQDEDWGDPKDYDLKIKREGERLETKYSVIASPKKPTPKTVLEEWLGMHVNLHALYRGGDPFADGLITNEQLASIKELREGANMDAKTFIAAIEEKFSVSDIRDATQDDAAKIIKWMADIPF